MVTLIELGNLEELVADLRSERVARGLPPERPDRFVDIPLSVILAERLRPLERIAVRFLSLLADGAYPRIESVHLEKYARDIRLLEFSRSLHGSIVALGARGIVGIIDKVRDAVDSGTVNSLDTASLLRNGHRCISWLRRDGIKSAYHDMELDVAEDEHLSAFFDAVRRLRSDPELLQAEITTAETHYESIKHLL